MLASLFFWWKLFQVGKSLNRIPYCTWYPLAFTCMFILCLGSGSEQLLIDDNVEMKANKETRFLWWCKAPWKVWNTYSKRLNSPVPFPTVCRAVSGPRVSKSSFISSAQKQRRRTKWRREGEYLDAPRQTPTMRPLRRRYGETNKGAAVHRSAPRLCSACLMNAIIRARQWLIYL